ncbi:regulatory protein, luxR family [Streptomyces zhaozhouensis]|uniref:Regulatory protein, luxR family n=1 Tax=Streptomyces zhaozhouensis TaxID=1300267 RepID=A0A286E0S2_9ACTN|nr:helix-turn-helix transcriptional regulator [Streptomyces zhaozhouensis]SOD64507.1 regulatory protein, luxR family [Streptomyces zhaozhouensis]
MTQGDSAMRTNHPSVDDENEELDSALLEVRGLLDTILSRHRDLRSSRGSITPVRCEGEALAERVARLCATARRHVEVILAPASLPGQPSTDALHDALARYEGPALVRVLTAETAETADRGGPRPPGTWRTAPLPPMRLLLVDRATALVRVDSPLGRNAAQVNDATLVGTLLSLFEGLWRRSAPLVLPEWDGRGDARLTRAVLRALSEGVTDETAARELGMSVRTYRRHVAEIMGRLGARSRFQAGALAAGLGPLGS